VSRRGFAGRLRDAWNGFWFAPASAENLGWCRLLFFAGLLYFFGGRDFRGFADMDRVFWNPTWAFRLLGFDQPSRPFLTIVQTVWRIALVAGCAGLFTRAATLFAFVTGSYLLGLLNAFGGSGSATGIVVFVLASLALSRCGDAVSIDRWLRGRRGIAGPANSGEYGWPVRVAWVVMAIAFFAAGLSKLRHSGLSWVSSDTLAILLVRVNHPLVRQANAPLFDWGLRLARHPWICRGVAAGSLAVELTFPLALFSRRLRPLIVSAALAMQIGIILVMGPNFGPFMLAYLFWVPWDRVVEPLEVRLGWRSQAAPTDTVTG
jgi:hypothetical protein